MSGTGKLYRVLKRGVRQREGAGFRRRRVGDVITVSDQGAAYLMGLGFIEPADGTPRPAVTIAPALPEPHVEPPPPRPRPAAPIERCPDHPRYRGRGEPDHGCNTCARIHAASHAHEAHE